jgi:hypothetical protein
VRFTPWYSAAEIEARAPAEAGVFQVRGATLRDYPTGRSAMIHYASAEDVRASMIRHRAQRGDSGDLYRHADALGGRSPAEALARLLERFVARFGAEPSPVPAMGDPGTADHQE